MRPDLGGVLVDVDPASIAEGMATIMDLAPDRRESVGRSLRGHVRVEYDLTDIVARWQALYTTVAAG